MIVGPIGTGKTSVAASGLTKLDPWEYRLLVVNMSAQTSSKNVQDNIEGNTEKKIKGERKEERGSSRYRDHQIY